MTKINKPDELEVEIEDGAMPPAFLNKGKKAKGKKDKKDKGKGKAKKEAKKY